MKKKVILSSILTIALCLSLIAGSTFALFTSESSVNIAVTSGTVKVTATIDETLGLYSPTSIGGNGNILEATNAAGNGVFANGGTAAINGNELRLTSLTPGDKVTVTIKIKNESNVAIKYRTILKSTEDNSLLSGLKITFAALGGEVASGFDTAAETFTGSALKSEWREFNGTEKTVQVAIELPATAGNNYQTKDCKLAFTVEAVQGNAEMPEEWDGEETVVPTPDPDDSSIYYINSAAEFMGLMNNAQSGSSVYSGKQIILTCDIDLGGATIPGFGNESCIFGGSFDGQGHTVSNFKIDRSDKEDYASLFNYYSYGTLENLTVKNATVIGVSKVGALIGGMYDGATVKNCTVEDCTVIANRKVGGAIGYVQGATVNKCAVKDTTVYCEVAEQAYEKDQWGEVIGYKNTGLDEGTGEDANTATNVTVLPGTTYVANGVAQQGSTYLISSAAGLNWFNDQINNHHNSFNNQTIKLTCDIDMKGAAWLPAGQNFKAQDYPALGYADPVHFLGTFDGDGHSISNIKITGLTEAQVDQLDDEMDAVTDQDIYSVGFFGYSNGTIKNLTIKNAEVKGYHNVGTIVGYTDLGAYIENCHVEYATISVKHISDDQCGDKVGGIVGYLNNNVNGADIKNCTVKNSTITACRDAGQVVGGAVTSAEVSDCSAENVTVAAAAGCCSEGNHGSNISSTGIIGRNING